MEKRICTKCKEEKELTIKFFYWNKNFSDFRTICIECWKKYYENNKEEIGKKHKEYNNTEAGRNSKYKWRGYKIDGHNFTIEDYNELYKKQKGKCANCKKNIKIGGKTTHIDHNHLTGKVRGLLCNNCNTGIGRLGGTIEALNNAINYLNLNN